MAYITGEFKHPNLEDLEIQVLNPTKDESDFEDGMQLSLEVPTIHRYAPNELKSLAIWILKTVEDIEAAYDESGKPIS